MLIIADAVGRICTQSFSSVFPVIGLPAFLDASYKDGLFRIYTAAQKSNGGKTISWYCYSGDAERNQMNSVDTIYVYVAIG